MDDFAAPPASTEAPDAESAEVPVLFDAAADEDDGALFDAGDEEPAAADEDEAVAFSDEVALVPGEAVLPAEEVEADVAVIAAGLVPIPSPLVAAVTAPAKMNTINRPEMAAVAMTPAATCFRRRCTRWDLTVATLRSASFPKTGVAVAEPPFAAWRAAGTSSSEEVSALAERRAVGDSCSERESAPASFRSFNLVAERFSMFLYICVAMVETAADTAAPITEPAMPIWEASRNDVVAAIAVAMICTRDRSSKMPARFCDSSVSSATAVPPFRYE